MIVAEVESKITGLAQLAVTNASQYAEELVEKTLRCGDVHKEYELIENLIKILHECIQESMYE